MFSDYHVHTSFSGDSKALPAGQAQAALNLGMEELCITDHHDYGTGHMTHIDFNLDIPAYLSGIAELKKQFEGKLTVRCGIELGLQLRTADYLRELVPTLSLDYLIGSSHFVDGFDIFDRRYYDGRTEYESYFRYFESTLARIRALDFAFDCLGHLDCVIRYGPEKNKNYRPADYMDIIDNILKALIERGKGIECNTSGFKYGLGHPHPYEEILRRYRELGGEILTVGSDAHRPEEVGGYFKETAELLSACGFRYYTVFRERKPWFLKIA